MLPAYRSWSTSKRVVKAAERCLAEPDESVSQIARNYGVTRQAVTKKRNELAAAQGLEVGPSKFSPKRTSDEKASDAARKLGVAVRVENERRRVPEDFFEFSDLYFSGWACPDCDDEHGDPIVHDTPEFQREIMAAANDPDTRRLLINLSPYHGKSTLLSVRRTVHQIVKNPNHRLLLVSETQPFAENLMQGITQMLTDPDLYIHSPRNLVEDWGPFKGTQPWNSNHIFVAGRETAEKDPTIQCLGIGSQIYGRRADEIVFDDIVSTKRSQSSETIEKDLQWIDKMALSRIGKKGRAIWVGTRVAPGDLYSILQQRQTYKVLKYPCIIDEANELTLWPEHFPFSQALIQRDEMTAADFQLVYQQVEMPGAGAAFTEEMVERCKDSERSWGHYEPGWRLVAGLDPAGANQWSGFTAMMLLGVDPSTGKRYLVDLVNIKQMKAPQIFDQMKRWSADYPLSEWRVENNGLQSQLFQYNHEIQQELIGLYGTRVVPHNTQGSNKWDPVFGVESMAPLFQNRMMSIPWANTQSRQKFQPLIEQLLSFPTGAVSDLVMCTWFADLAARDLLRRDSLPMFNDRMKVPGRVKKRRHVVDFASQQVRGVPLADQRPGHLQGGGRRQRRMTSDRIKEHAQVEEFDAPEGPSFVNV